MLRHPRGPRPSAKQVATCVAIGLLALVLAVPTAMRSPTAAAQTGPVLSVEPAASDVQAGDVFTVSVAVRDVVDLMAFQFTMQFDPAVARFRRAQVGPFLGTTGRRVIPLGPITDTGKVSFGATSFPGSPGPSGGGTLALVAFSAEGPGESALELGKVLLSDTQNRPITVTAATGAIVTVSGAPPGWPHVFLPQLMRP